MIVITGGQGVLGTALVAELKQIGRPFHVLSRSSVDLRDAALTLAAFKDIAPTMVIHAAARVHGLGGNTNFPGEMFADNIKINMSVIEAALQCRCEKFVGVSTIATYPADAAMPINESSIWNGPPHKSELAYAQAKRAMLAQLEAYAMQYGISYAYPILTNLYGPHDRFDQAFGHVVPSLVSKFFHAAKNGGAVDVWGSGTAERDFIHASDAARAILRIADAHEGPINVASGRVVRIRQMVEILADHAKVRDVRWDSSKPDGQLVRSYDISRLEALGFKSTIPLERGLAETYDWFAANYPNVRTV